VDSLGSCVRSMTVMDHMAPVPTFGYQPSNPIARSNTFSASAMPRQ
jgi:hypothetical protein